MQKNGASQLNTPGQPAKRFMSKRLKNTQVKPRTKQTIHHFSQSSRNDIENTMEWAMYRKRFGLDRKTKIFICKQYFSFKKALLERGWHENTDFNSPVFHLKFTIKRDSIFGIA